MPNDTSPARPACQGIDPELFFGHTSLEAIAACAGCPVREACATRTLDAEFDYAIDQNGLATDQEHPYRGGAIKAYGHAGGLTARERTGILSARGRSWHQARLALAADTLTAFAASERVA